MSTDILKVKKLTDTAKLPEKQHIDDAAFDLYSDESVILAPSDIKLVSTGISFTVPVGTYGRIAPRSGLSTKGIFINAGVIDRNYTGEVKVILNNFGKNEIELPKFSRIAQLIVEKISNPSIIEVDELDPTERESGGFGSTGL